MKNVVKNKEKETSSIVKDIEDVLVERIKQNRKLFSRKELMIIQNNVLLTEKIYMLGIIDSKSCNN